ncbi:hypothetical protein B0T19DRAFT_456866 [Cercophora scortea]|uniref:Uncharacterized protein n=1 Tax=Cercophora scortea TaxID=314031 RepID=A0AAE0MHU5_9PEZI|nr:hypothetical protein B0T19DRAFT_456866 [Cercophora scortea]
MSRQARLNGQVRYPGPAGLHDRTLPRLRPPPLRTPDLRPRQARALFRAPESFKTYRMDPTNNHIGRPSSPPVMSKAETEIKKFGHRDKDCRAGAPVVAETSLLDRNHYTTLHPEEMPEVQEVLNALDKSKDLDSAVVGDLIREVLESFRARETPEVGASPSKQPSRAADKGKKEDREPRPKTPPGQRFKLPVSEIEKNIAESRSHAFDSSLHASTQAELDGSIDLPERPLEAAQGEGNQVEELEAQEQDEHSAPPPHTGPEDLADASLLLGLSTRLSEATTLSQSHSSTYFQHSLTSGPTSEQTQSLSPPTQAQQPPAQSSQPGSRPSPLHPTTAHQQSQQQQSSSLQQPLPEDQANPEHTRPSRAMFSKIKEVAHKRLRLRSQGDREAKEDSELEADFNEFNDLFFESQNQNSQQPFQASQQNIVPSVRPPVLASHPSLLPQPHSAASVRQSQSSGPAMDTKKQETEMASSRGLPIQASEHAASRVTAGLRMPTGHTSEHAASRVTIGLRVPTGHPGHYSSAMKTAPEEAEEDLAENQSGHEGSNNPDGRENPDGQESPEGQEDPDGEENPKGQEDPDGHDNQSGGQNNQNGWNGNNLNPNDPEGPDDSDVSSSESDASSSESDLASTGWDAAVGNLNAGMSINPAGFQSIIHTRTPARGITEQVQVRLFKQTRYRPNGTIRDVRYFKPVRHGGHTSTSHQPGHGPHMTPANLERRENNMNRYMNGDNGDDEDVPFAEHIEHAAETTENGEQVENTEHTENTEHVENVENVNQEDAKLQESTQHPPSHHHPGETQPEGREPHAPRDATLHPPAVHPGASRHNIPRHHRTSSSPAVVADWQGPVTSPAEYASIMIGFEYPLTQATGTPGPSTAQASPHHGHPPNPDNLAAVSSSNPFGHMQQIPAQQVPDSSTLVSEAQGPDVAFYNQVPGPQQFIPGLNIIQPAPAPAPVMSETTGEFDSNYWMEGDDNDVYPGECEYSTNPASVEAWAGMVNDESTSGPPIDPFTNEPMDVGHDMQGLPPIAAQHSRHTSSEFRGSSPSVVGGSEHNQQPGDGFPPPSRVMGNMNPQGQPPQRGNMPPTSFNPHQQGQDQRGHLMPPQFGGGWQGQALHGHMPPAPGFVPNTQNNQYQQPGQIQPPPFTRQALPDQFAQGQPPQVVPQQQEQPQHGGQMQPPNPAQRIPLDQYIEPRPVHLLPNPLGQYPTGYMQPRPPHLIRDPQGRLVQGQPPHVIPGPHPRDQQPQPGHMQQQQQQPPQYPPRLPLPEHRLQEEAHLQRLREEHYERQGLAHRADGLGMRLQIPNAPGRAAAQEQQQQHEGGQAPFPPPPPPHHPTQGPPLPAHQRGPGPRIYHHYQLEQYPDHHRRSRPDHGNQRPVPGQTPGLERVHAQEGASSAQAVGVVMQPTVDAQNSASNPAPVAPAAAVEESIPDVAAQNIAPSNEAATTSAAPTRPPPPSSPAPSNTPTAANDASESCVEAKASNAAPAKPGRKQASKINEETSQADTSEVVASSTVLNENIASTPAPSTPEQKKKKTGTDTGNAELLDTPRPKTAISPGKAKLPYNSKIAEYYCCRQRKPSSESHELERDCVFCKTARVDTSSGNGFGFGNAANPGSSTSTYFGRRGRPVAGYQRGGMAAYPNPSGAECDSADQAGK